jgi:hypothetical protein
LIGTDKTGKTGRGRKLGLRKKRLPLAKTGRQ